MFAGAILLISCNRPPSDSSIVSDFLRECPKAKVLSVGVGEGDASAVYYHIRYQLSDNSQIHEDVWLYVRDVDGRWKLRNRERNK